MSNAPPHFDPPTDGSYNDADLSDLYLSTPGGDPDEASFMSSGIRVTPSREEDQSSTHNTSTSPLAFSANGPASLGNDDGYSSYTFLSPTGDFTSNPSVHTSSTTDFGATGIWQHDGSTPSIQNPTHGRFGSISSDISSSHMTMNPYQLLTPVLTNNPSPTSDTNSVSNQRGFRSLHHPQPLTLITTPINNSLGIHPGPDSAQAISPIVKVESYSRGDSPVRDVSSMNRRRSQSSAHLSPGGLSTGSDEDDEIEEDCNSISRGHNGAWILHRATGHGGVGPTARKDVYVPSPNEMDSQRKLGERNADIWNWSEAVSEAHSEAGDEPSRHRGRTDHHGNRRRAKSAGDPSLQQDYFNLKYNENTLAVPGPGLLIHEPSEYSEEATDSPAVSVDRYMHEDSEVSPLNDPGAEEPLPSQFLATRPWRDPEHEPSPTEAQNQPQSSSAAMVEFQRRAKDFDTASRWATWGTGGMDAKSIKSFRNLSIKDKEKKHKRQDSLLTRFTKKPTNNLKRQRQPTDLSTNQSGAETAKGEEFKPSPQRKDSFPRKLSIPFSPKSPGLNTGGAIISMTKQMASIGGNKDTLQVASPTSPISSTWSSFKARRRSRSELPRAPGLFELMTSHGGPPAPIIALSPQEPDADQGPQTGLDTEHDGNDDDNDDDLNDEKGIVMDFPILSNLPVPTFEGFKTQIIQLNPRLEPALIDRFAQEQLRRYRKLIEAKHKHALAVGRNKCSAGKSCFAQGGQAKLLPPRTSPQNGEFAHTQFQIPGRGEVDDNPQALGETAIATAQFPPGVPFPPPQVTKLPAEFECPFCFQVKKFQKPSDWTKHIYEDVQPFMCTFPHCPDPKSFKRKADWVRHESERHRQLEWWECNFQDCRHKCYRKDNFVQHLVREHKLPEPKVKKIKCKGSAAKGPQNSMTPEMQEEMRREQEVNQLWALVEHCRHDTTSGPKDEPCRFCGNVCSSWKKLTVHLAKHMEQIAIPILSLVNERDFPSNSGAPLAGTVDPCSAQIPIMHTSNEFAPNLNGVTDGPGPSMDFTQAQYPSTQAGGPGSLGHPTYLATSMAMQSSGLMVAEPESMNSLENASSLGHHQPGLPGTLGAPGDQLRMMSMHQTAVTYPPPFNSGPRPRTSNQELSVLQDYSNFTMSPTETHYDPHNTVYVSPPADSYYSGPMAPSSMPYNPPGGYQEQH